MWPDPYYPRIHLFVVVLRIRIRFILDLRIRFNETNPVIRIILGRIRSRIRISFSTKRNRGYGSSTLICGDNSGSDTLLIMLSPICTSRSSGWVINEKEKAEVLGFKLSLGLETILSRYRQSDSASGQLFVDCKR